MGDLSETEEQGDKGQSDEDTMSATTRTCTMGKLVLEWSDKTMILKSMKGGFHFEVRFDVICRGSALVLGTMANTCLSDYKRHIRVLFSV
jgi:hypothetical protein